MKDGARIAILYALFAAVATGANLGSQALATMLYQGPLAFAVSLVIGTLVGLPIKYVLDKKFIFRFTARELKHDGRLFLLYGALALVTTTIFWGTETIFELLFTSQALRLLGGGLGLIVGYLIKYRLDKKYVFVHDALEEGDP